MQRRRLGGAPLFQLADLRLNLQLLLAAVCQGRFQLVVARSEVAYVPCLCCRGLGLPHRLGARCLGLAFRVGSGGLRRRMQALQQG